MPLKGFGYIPLDDYRKCMSKLPEDIPAAVLQSIPVSIVRELRVVPFHQNDAGLHVFCPMGEHFAMEAANRVRFAVDEPIQFVPLENAELLAAIEKFYAAESMNLGSIDNCPLNFHYKCPRTWDSLNVTEQADIRFCDVCQHQVYWANSYQDAERQAALGRCVAVFNDYEETMGILYIDEEL